MTGVSVCNWSLWAQASNYFLDNLLSISHQAACQIMLMSPELLVWILRSRLFCFGTSKGEVGAGQQLAVRSIGTKVGLSRPPLARAERENAPEPRAQSTLTPVWHPACLPFSWLLDSHSVGRFGFIRTSWKAFERMLLGGWCHWLREQGNFSNNLLFGKRRGGRVLELDRPVFLLSRGRMWPSLRWVYHQQQLHYGLCVCSEAQWNAIRWEGCTNIGHRPCYNGSTCSLFKV